MLFLPNNWRLLHDDNCDTAWHAHVTFSVILVSWWHLWQMTLTVWHLHSGDTDCTTYVLTILLISYLYQHDTLLNMQMTLNCDTSWWHPEVTLISRWHLHSDEPCINSTAPFSLPHSDLFLSSSPNTMIKTPSLPVCSCNCYCHESPPVLPPPPPPLFLPQL